MRSLTILLVLVVVRVSSSSAASSESASNTTAEATVLILAYLLKSRWSSCLSHSRVLIEATIRSEAIVRFGIVSCDAARANTWQATTAANLTTKTADTGLVEVTR